jgi:hypothetical protein
MEVMTEALNPAILGIPRIPYPTLRQNKYPIYIFALDPSSYSSYHIDRYFEIIARHSASEEQFKNTTASAIKAQQKKLQVFLRLSASDFCPTSLPRAN